MNTMMIQDRLLCEKDAASRYGWSQRTMQGWRMTGGGPPYLKIGRMVRYREVDIELWLDSKRVKSTSEDGGAA